jgi:hypothetical protein
LAGTNKIKQIKQHERLVINKQIVQSQIPVKKDSLRKQRQFNVAEDLFIYIHTKNHGNFFFISTLAETWND